MNIFHAVNVDITLYEEYNGVNLNITGRIVTHVVPIVFSPIGGTQKGMDIPAAEGSIPV